MKRNYRITFLGTAVLGVSAALLVPATAAPNERMPNTNSRDRGNRGDRGNRYSDGQRVEIAATVRRNTYNETSCQVRGDDGHVYTVRTSSRLNLRKDQRVRVTGVWRNGYVENAGINLIDGYTGGTGGNYSPGQKVEIAATVLSDVNGGRVLSVRADGGTRYLVSASSPVTLRRDARVKVTGVWRDNMISDAGVNFLDSDNDGRPDYGSDSGQASDGQRMEFLGYVTDRVSGDTSFRVTADSGTTYRVSASSAVRLRRNERVKVTGTWTNGTVTNAGVNIVDDNGDGRPDFDPNYSQNYEGQRVDFPGTVLDDVRSSSTVRVRGENNVVYTVIAPRTVNLNHGQRVRVTGDWRGGVVTNAGINLQ